MNAPQNLEFSMPMFRKSVPERIRPFIYLAFGIIFQLTSGVYLGSMASMKGELSMMQEDIMMCGYAGFIGLTMPFPLLFRFKFRFWNKSMLTFCAAVIILCNIISLHTESLPLLWAACFAAGWCKLWATFECISNIQLWMAPGRDFYIFFPLLYIVVLSCIEMSGIMSELCCHYLTWEFAPVTIIFLLLIVIAVLQLFTVNFRPGKPFPLYGIDWTGLVLWTFLLLELSFVFIYGEHYNWLDGKPIRYTLAAAAVTAGFCFGRMRKVRHPYIEVKSWKYSNIAPTVILFLFVCLISSTSTVLENAFSHGIIPYSHMEGIKAHIVNIAGVVAGSLFCLYWFKRLKATIGTLTIIGMLLMVAYCMMMFFLISPDTAQSDLWLPAFIRQMGYSIIFSSLTLYIEAQMPFQHFFQGLCIIGMARTVLGGAIGGALYGYLLRYNIASQSAILGYEADAEFVSSAGIGSGELYGEMMNQVLMVSIKNIYGFVFLCGCLLCAAMLIFDSPIRRRYLRMPDWGRLRERLGLDTIR